MNSLAPIIIIQKYRQQIVKLKGKINNVSTQIKTSESDINLCFFELEQENEKYTNRSKQLEIDIKKLQIVKNATNKAQGKPEQKYFKSSQEQAQTSNAKKYLDQDPETKKACQKAFQQIAKKCHPDITNDSEKHELYKKANQYYEDCDFAKINDLINHLEYNTGVIPKFKDFDSEELKLQREIQILEKELEQKKKEIMMIKSQPTYQIMRQYNSDDPLEKLNAQKQFVMILMNRLTLLTQTKINIERSIC